MKKVKIITNCPSCNSALERVKDQLFCRNVNCIATQEKRVLHFIKTMKIIGLGEITVEKLNIETIEDIYNLDAEKMNNTIGEKLSTKILQEIEKSKATNIEKLIPAFSIPLVSKTAAKKVFKVCNFMDEITYDVCKEAGLGDIASTNLANWIENEYPKYKDLPLTFEANSNRIESRNIKVCITGKLTDYRSRELASSYLEEQGITVVSGVSKALDFLINEDNKPSSKLSKANSYSIPIVTIKQLIEEYI